MNINERNRVIAKTTAWLERLDKDRHYARSLDHRKEIEAEADLVRALLENFAPNIEHSDV